MDGKRANDHLRIVSLLPDYVLGKLDEASLKRVERHIATCVTCHDEMLNAMNALVELANVAPPPSRVREDLLRRAVAERPSSPPRVGGSRRPLAPTGSLPASTARPATRKPWLQSIGAALPTSTWTLLAASLAILIVVSLGGWSLRQQAGSVTDARIDSLVDNPAFAYPLDDSDLPVSAAGVVFAEPSGRDMYLVANGLPILPENQRYQVWLFTTANTQESAGLLSVEDDGDLRALLETPDPFAEYVGVGITAEPRTGSPIPTSDLVLGGSFPAATAFAPSQNVSSS
jgi:anti-sigma-K factor RskA